MLLSLDPPVKLVVVVAGCGHVSFTLGRRIHDIRRERDVSGTTFTVPSRSAQAGRDVMLPFMPPLRSGGRTEGCR